MGNVGKIFIDPGHGGTDPGASDLVVEKEVVLEISRILGDILKSKGITVEYSRISNSTTVGLSERANKGNSCGADLFISIHANSFSSLVSGTETYVYTSPSQSSKDLATKIVNSISSDMVLSNRGMKQIDSIEISESLSKEPFYQIYRNYYNNITASQRKNIMLTKGIYISAQTSEDKTGEYI